MFFKLSITGLKKGLLPGSAVNLKIKSKPDSIAYLLAVDRSVNILRIGNDIDHTKVYKDLNSYNAYKNFESLKIEGRLIKDLENYDEGRYSDFGESNAFVMTNAYKGKVRCLKERSGSELEDDPESFMNEAEDYEMKATPNDDVDNVQSKTRDSFPETWIFEHLQLDSEGTGILNTTLPDTITSWDITGFSMHNVFGLGIAKAKSLVVEQNFYIMMNLPYSIRVGEILKVEIQVFSKFTKSYNVAVTLFSHKVIENKLAASAENEKDTNKEKDEDEDEDSETTMTIDEPVAEETNVSGSKGNFEEQLEFYEGELSGGSCKYSSSQKSNNEKERTVIISVAGKSAQKTHFFIKAKRQGSIQLKVRAKLIGFKTYDEVVRNLKVKNEGHISKSTEGILINLRDGKQLFSYNFDIPLDEDFIRNSLKISTSVVGDLNGPALINTNKLM